MPPSFCCRRRSADTLLDVNERADQLLERLTEPQKRAVTHRDGPLLVVAGPGSGKTRVITHRAAYLAATGVPPRHILAITFTNKAAREMADRMERLGVGRATCSTFHSFCARLLRMYGERGGVPANYVIFDESDQLAALREVIASGGRDPESLRPAMVLARISRAKNSLIMPEDYAAQAAGFEERAVAEIYAAYEASLAAQHALDFDDLLVRTALLLGNDPDLRVMLEGRYRYVLVDEYQDTNYVQYLIARGLSLERRNLCVTGDPDQSIYSWRGADIQNILQFQEDFPDAEIVRLEQNYRSSPEILSAADALIACNTRRLSKALWTTNIKGPPVKVVEAENEIEEAAAIASAIGEHAQRGGTYGQIAVFYRTNALSRVLEQALRQTGIPYQVARGTAFYQRREIKDLLAYCRVAVNPLDQVSFLRIINTPTRGLGKVAVERLVAHARQSGQSLLEAARQADQVQELRRVAGRLRGFAELIDGIAAAGELGAQAAIEYALQNSGLVAAWGSSGAGENDPLDNAHELINAAAEYDRRAEEGDRLQVIGDRAVPTVPIVPPVPSPAEGLEAGETTGQGTGSAVRVAVPVPVPPGAQEGDRVQVIGDSAVPPVPIVAEGSPPIVPPVPSPAEGLGAGETAAPRQDTEDAGETPAQGTGSAVRVAVPVPAPQGTLRDWLTEVSLVADVDAVDPEVGAVTLMTLHGAKGLEYDVVFIAGVEDGILPHKRSEDDPLAREEERRLLFVGMTRARRSLTITSARWRSLRGRVERTRPSPFLRELPREQLAFEALGDEGRRGYDEAERLRPRDLEGWGSGSYVRHPEYGIGRVLWMTPRGGRTHVAVQFSEHGQKTFVLEAANLELVDPDEIGEEP